MASGIYIPMAGAVAQSTALDVTANNLANVGTNGFRAERASFNEVLTKTRSQDSRFVAVAKTSSDLTPGTVNETGNPLDLALQGDGYFALQTPAGVRYTRDGKLHLNEAGELASADGFPLLGKGGTPIAVGKNVGDVEIEEDGSVLANGKQVGQLELSRFAPAQLTHDGKNHFIAQGAPLTTGDDPTVESGSLEGSNVNPVRCVVDLIRVSRAYESLHRMIEANKEIDDRAARGIGGR